MVYMCLPLHTLTKRYTFSQVMQPNIKANQAFMQFS